MGVKVHFKNHEIEAIKAMAKGISIRHGGWEESYASGTERFVLKINEKIQNEGVEIQTKPKGEWTRDLKSLSTGVYHTKEDRIIRAKNKQEVKTIYDIQLIAWGKFNEYSKDIPGTLQIGSECGGPILTREYMEKNNFWVWNQPIKHHEEE